MYGLCTRFFTLNVKQDFILILKECLNISSVVGTKDPDGGKQITRSEEMRQKAR